ncbi:ATP-binding protein [Virgibacillus ihumii]|uniref:ATP-binding protein n=1 Tax=Virgibacillus ihumii TaxID=2686091 RepID=UPI00157E0A06|nr:sensor histidine kinase [Virgibacillus ihumii]
MREVFKVSLQTKILVLIITLISFLIILLTGIFAFIEANSTENQMKRMALQTAKTVSFMPAVRNAMTSGKPGEQLQLIAEQVREQSDAASVIITNKKGVIYSHPEPAIVGENKLGNDSYMAVVFGGYYNSEADGRIGEVIRGTAPIYKDFGDYSKIVGIVTVGYLKSKIHSTVQANVVKTSFFALVVMTIGIGGGVLLAKNIKKETLGLEPSEIASLYRERNATLQSIREGVLAIDGKGNITTLNRTAKELLHLTDEAIHQPVDKFLPNTGMLQVLKTGKADIDQEMTTADRVLIVNRIPAFNKNKIVGVVSSFRDKTELQGMINTLSEVRKYSEELRAQTHEFSNKLYVISGMLQLGKYNEAIDMIQAESEVNTVQNKIVFEQIRDTKIQAILLGKISKASEKKIDFTVEPDSSLQMLPEHIKISQLVIIVGNIIDNAFEAVEAKQRTEGMHVSFFALDMGNDIIFEISDNGIGIPENQLGKVFDTGYSKKKGNKRGFGLANVKRTAQSINATIEINQREGGGTIFTVYIPKVREGDQ